MLPDPYLEDAEFWFVFIKITYAYIYKIHCKEEFMTSAAAVEKVVFRWVDYYVST